MKKYFLLLTCCLALLFVSACGSSETPAPEAPETTTEETTAEETTTEETAAELDCFPAFEAVDLDGNPVTDAIFAEKDLTVVNVWATFCGPCIGEMPELAEWSHSMPDNVQIIGLVADIADMDADAELVDTAKEIVDKSGADYLHIAAVGSDFDDLFNLITGVPTTFFVDSEGNFAADMIVGADVKGYQQTVEAYLAGLE